jgi:hypothetical protein
VKALDRLSGENPCRVPKKLVETPIANFGLTKVCREQQAGCSWDRTKGLREGIWTAGDVYRIPDGFDDAPVAHFSGSIPASGHGDWRKIPVTLIDG